jgi:hypothetical protein
MSEKFTTCAQCGSAHYGYLDVPAGKEHSDMEWRIFADKNGVGFCSAECAFNYDLMRFGFGEVKDS